MAIDHEMHRKKMKEYSNKTGHDVTYNDGGAPSAPKEFGDKNDSIRNQDRAAVTRKAWESGEYDARGNYVGAGKGVKPKRK